LVAGILTYQLKLLRPFGFQALISEIGPIIVRITRWKIIHGYMSSSNFRKGEDVRWKYENKKDNQLKR
jgi:hypothetical protein